MIDQLWPNGPLFKYAKGVSNPGIDSILLTYFAHCGSLKKNEREVDIGCGSGIISVILAWDNPSLLIDSIEIQVIAARLASENIALNNMGERVSIIEGDLRKHRELLNSGAYDFAISNPPYHPQGSGKITLDTSISNARMEENCTLADICQAAAYMTRYGGAFYLVHLPERIAEIFHCLRETNFEPKRLRFVQHNQSSPPNLVLIESRRGGKPPLKVEAPLILKKEGGDDTDELKLALHLTTDS